MPYSLAHSTHAELLPKEPVAVTIGKLATAVCVTGVGAVAATAVGLGAPVAPAVFAVEAVEAVLVEEGLILILLLLLAAASSVLPIEASRLATVES